MSGATPGPVNRAHGMLKLEEIDYGNGIALSYDNRKVGPLRFRAAIDFDGLDSPQTIAKKLMSLAEMIGKST